jgi:tryptophan 7-halogenase
MSSSSTSKPNAAGIQKLVIVGGGTAGWMAAAALAKILKSRIAIELVESDEIGTVGVGEATIPMINVFNHAVGIDENEFIRATNGTFKLGIEFVNWGKLGDRYIHGFGRFGQDLGSVDFHQYWLKQYLQGKAPDLEAFSINRMACRANKFMRPDASLANSPLSEIAYAFHFDAGLYAKFLRGISERAGVKRTEGKIGQVKQHQDGRIASVVLESGVEISGDLFLDCSGFQGLLIEKTLQTGYADWTHWLPCDRAVAVPCENAPQLTPYTRATAHKSGWQWRIPLQHRMGNGHVYCSSHISDDEAASVLLGNLDGKALADPRFLRFKTGMRKKIWNKNVVSVGLSSGFLEPLESTSIHLIQTTIAKLVSFFPDRDFAQDDIDEFNTQMAFEFESVRDFIILHYHVNQRDDSAFWIDCRNMAVPENLKQRIALWQSRGRLKRFNLELFAEVGWLQVLHGQNLRPQGAHALVDVLPEQDVDAFLGNIQNVIRRCVDLMPEHSAFIKDTCAA